MLEPTEEEKVQSAVIQIKRSFNTLQSGANSLLTGINSSILGIGADDMKAALGDADFELVRSRLEEFTKEPEPAPAPEPEPNPEA